MTSGLSGAAKFTFLARTMPVLQFADMDVTRSTSSTSGNSGSLKEQLARYGSAGLLSYGCLNLSYYTLATVVAIRLRPLSVAAAQETLIGGIPHPHTNVCSHVLPSDVIHLRRHIFSFSPSVLLSLHLCIIYISYDISIPERPAGVVCPIPGDLSGIRVGGLASDQACTALGRRGVGAVV